MKLPIAILGLSIALTSLPGYSEVAAGVHVGTTGIGADVTVSVNDHWSVRGVISRYSRDFDNEVDDIEYEFDMDLSNAALLADWHPTGGLFRVSAGLMINNNSFKGEARPVNATVEIGDQTFQTNVAGTLKADVSYDTLAPYVGVGWSNAVNKPGLGFAVDLGVMYQGEADVSIKSRGADASVASAIEAELETEEQDVQDELDEYKLYPLVSVGMTYRF